MTVFEGPKWIPSMQKVYTYVLVTDTTILCSREEKAKRNNIFRYMEDAGKKIIF